MENKEEIISKIQDYFKQKGVEVSKEEAESILNFADLGKQGKLEGKDKMVYDFLNGNGELSEDQLELIAGGRSGWDIFCDILSTPFRAVGSALGAVVAALETPIMTVVAPIVGNNIGDSLKEVWVGCLTYSWEGYFK